MKKNQVTPNTSGESEGVHPEDSIWNALKKGGFLSTVFKIFNIEQSSQK